MHPSGFSKWLAMAFLVALVVALGATAPGVSAQDGDNLPPPPPKQELTYPNLGSHLSGLVDAYEEGRASQSESAEQAAISQGGSVAVTIYLTSNVAEVAQFLWENGGDPRNVGEDYIEAYVPVSLLGRLSEQPGVVRVREIIPPQPEFGPITSQGVQAHLVAPWHSAGITGEGVKVGIIDSFEGIRSLMGTELPATVVGRCYTSVGRYSSNLGACDRGSPHGTGVAEAIVDVAPSVSLYIANPTAPADLQSTVDWMVSQGVSVVNRSASYPWFDGPGDGSSRFTLSELNTINRAVDGEVVWVNSAGNYATETWFSESPRIYTTSIVDFVAFDGANDFTNGVLGLGGENTIFLRWDDRWNGASSDLDLLLWDTIRGEYVARSESYQTGQVGHDPWERVRHEMVRGRLYQIVVAHRSGRVPDWVQVVARRLQKIEHFTENGSINNPSESANDGMLAVGATHYWNTNAIAEYSSQGPTPDGRIKPDIVGTACAEADSYELEPPRFYGGNNCWFPGTSQAAPHVAGLAALVKQANPSFTPEQVADYLKNTAADRTPSGPDNTWGYGFAQLPAPPAQQPPGMDQCGETITADGSVSGTWAAGCESGTPAPGTGSGARVARYYSFTLAQQSAVTIDLESTVDTYLYLREGDARSGTARHVNDDHANAGLARTTDSRISETLPAGTYTIEATTYAAGAAGGFTLTVSGLGGTTVGPDPGPGADTCGETITGDGTVNGTWAAGCESAVSERGYARYYSFTLAQQSTVTIELESTDADTYLYLRAGDARSGAFIDEDDDTPDTTRSEIVATLDAGTYTIEATTYAAGAAGGFTLTVSGLGGTTVGPDPGPGADTCGETITGDGTVNGTWAAGCESAVSERGYARYYSFTLAQQSTVTIELESTDADTYLYLRAGDARSGAFIDEDDDTPDTTRSEIVATLDAGTYTIEATTYAAGAAGGFTLTVSGLGGTTVGPDPGPGADTCGETITGDGTVNGTWAAGCESAVSERGYARYYSFTLAQQSTVTIELESTDADTYLYLRMGDARSGTFIDEDDDTPDTTRSEIVATLDAGTYTIEATTYAAGAAGGFTLTVSGLGGTTVGPDPTPGTDACGETITGDGTVNGTWAAGCESAVSERGYARYYSFTLAQQSTVTIELESTDADTYLYLRMGDARSGAFIDEDDDTPDTTRSEIVATLDAGTYTIEATTYAAGAAGGFTLTVSGLGGTATGPDPTPGTDACGETITGDGTVNGTWAAGCESAVSERGYARYYSFTTTEARDVTIALKSSVDTYLYLRSGDRTGSVEGENDDHGTLLDNSVACSTAAGLGARDSCITVIGLPAGEYTIEATTYAAATAGTFILTISGLDGG